VELDARGAPAGRMPRAAARDPPRLLRVLVLACCRAVRPVRMWSPGGQRVGCRRDDGQAMSEQEFDRVIETGRRNQQAKALLANHCAHARLELPDGTSMAGSMLGLDIGMAWVRCQHAPMPTTMSMHGLDLAVAFYEQNCRGCPHRSPNGLLPTIATEADDRRRAAEQAEARSAAQLADAVAAWEQRRGSRRTAVAAEGYPARRPSGRPRPTRPASGRRQRQRRAAGIPPAGRDGPPSPSAVLPAGGPHGRGPR